MCEERGKHKINMIYGYMNLTVCRKQSRFVVLVTGKFIPAHKTLSETIL